MLVTFKVHYCIESKQKYLSYNQAKVFSSVDSIVSILEFLETDEDTVYVDVIEHNDTLIINGDEDGGLFVEIDTTKGGIFSKNMTVDEVRFFLNNPTFSCDKLISMGFVPSSI